MRTNRPAIQRASALALGAFVLALSLIGTSGANVAADHLDCAEFEIVAPKSGTYTNGTGFSVTITIIRLIDVTFEDASRPVAHLQIWDSGRLPADYPYEAPGPTSDLDPPHPRSPSGGEITRLRFCFRPPATATPSSTPSPTQRPTPTPTLRPTATPSEKPTQKPTLTPTNSPIATPTQPATPTPTAVASFSAPAPSISAPASEVPTATPQPTPSGTAALPPTPTPSPTPSLIPTEIATPSPSPSPTPTPAPTPEPVGGTGGGPGSFVTSIPTPDKLGSDAIVIGQSLLLAILFLLLAAFPAQLFNKTLEENYLEVSGWFAVGGRWTARIREGLAAFWRRRAGLILFLVLSAMLYGFLSPEFGPTLESAASLLGILGGLAIVIAAFEIPLVYFYRTRLKDRGRLAVQPLTIFVGIACVVISRIADFQPGYLYGLVVGYVYARELTIRDEGRANALTAIWMLTVSLAAFVSLPLLESASASTPLLQMAVAAGLATIFIGGLEGLLFELVPLRFLRGETVWAWHRVAWGILFLAAAFTFVHILLTPTSGYLGSTRTSPLLAAVTLFVAFGVFSVAFWAYFRYRPPRVAEPSVPAS